MPQYEVTLSEQDKQNATKILFEPEDDKLRENAVRDIQEWIKENPHLNARNDEKNVVRFLRSCKYRLERTKFKIKNYYQLRGKEDAWFTNRDPQDATVDEFLRMGVFLPLHGHDKEGRTVVLVRTAVHNPQKQSVMDLFKIGKMLMDLLMELDETISVNGVQAILDLSGNTMSHSLQLTPNRISKAVHAWQDCYPIRTRSLDFFNAPGYVNVVLKIFLMFMNEKLKQRVHVLGSKRSELHKIVDPSLLPTEYGGTAGPVQDLIDFWVQRANDHRDWFLEDEKYRADV